jgi:ATP-binding cassette, subfamily B, bacterial PglK
MSFTSQGTSVTRAICRAWGLVDPPSRRRLALLSVYGCAIAALDTLALLLVYALMNLLGNQPAAGLSNGILQTLHLNGADRYGTALILLAITAALFIARSLLSVLGLWWTVGASNDATANLIARLLRGYACAPQLIRHDHSPAKTLRTILFSVDAMGQIVRGSVALVSNWAVVFAVAIALVLANPKVALAATVYFALIGLAWVRSARRRFVESGDRQQRLQEERGRLMLQGLGAAKELQLRGRALFYADQAVERTRGLNAAIRGVTVASLSVRYVLETSLVVGATLIVAVAGFTGGRDSVLPAIGLVLAGAFRFLPALNQILYLTNQIQFNVPARDVVDEELRTFGAFADEHPTPRSSATVPLRFQRELRLEAVTFQYPKRPEPTLRGVSLVVRRGESVGIIGPSGSGKSTLLDVILGLLEPDAGFVSIDGVMITDRLDMWQRSIGYVPQDVYLVDDTVRANVALGWHGEEIDDEAVVEAIRVAGLSDVVAKLPNGLETVVGDRGVRLSGGQRQRVGIARAIYTRPRILVLDEATSSLDRATEQRIVETLASLGKDVTMIIVTHRIASLHHCDRILYLDAGVIRAEGTIDEVRESLPVFDKRGETPRLRAERA